MPKFSPLGKNLLFFIITLFSFIVVLVLVSEMNRRFTARYTNQYAIEQLMGQDYEAVAILSRRLVRHRYLIPPLPKQDWFYFTAWKDGQAVKGALICYRQVWDIRESRCDIGIFQN